MKTYVVKNERTGLADEAWTVAGMIEELAGALKDENPDALSSEDLSARHLDMAILEALRDFQAISAKLVDAGLTQMIEDIRAEKKLPLPPDEDAVIGLRLLLARIRRHAVWVPQPMTREHDLFDALVIGTVERFKGKSITYGTTLMGERTGAMASEEAARRLVLEEAVAGALTDAENTRRDRMAAADAGVLGVKLVADLQLHGPGSIFDSLKVLGVSYVSASPLEHGPGRERWEIRGATNVPAELPAWLALKEGAK
jgi:hypothetical protein